MSRRHRFYARPLLATAAAFGILTGVAATAPAAAPAEPTAASAPSGT